MTFKVHFTEPVVNHLVGKTAARPIRGLHRSSEIEMLRGKRFSASVEYASRIKHIDKDVFVSVNRDGIVLETPQTC